MTLYQHISLGGPGGADAAAQPKQGEMQTLPSSVIARFGGSNV